MDEAFDITFRELTPDARLITFVRAQLACLTGVRRSHCSVVLRRARGDAEIVQAHVELERADRKHPMHADANGRDVFCAVRSAFSTLRRSIAVRAVLRTEHQRTRVLVIDDDPITCRLLELRLGEPYEIATSTSSRKALARLLAGEHFDLIVCDMMMPEFSGADVYEVLLASRPELAACCLFVTGGGCDERTRRFLSTTRRPWLPKTASREQLIRTLDDLLADRYD